MGFKVDPNADLFPEGYFLFEVVSCEARYSKAGDGMFFVGIKDVESGRQHYEHWMMEGKGQGMTVPKLKALGVDLSGDVEARDLIGRRMYAQIVHKERSDTGELQAQIRKTFSEAKPPAEFAQTPLITGDKETDDKSLPF